MRRISKSIKNQRGVTLIELFFYIAILIVLVFISTNIVGLINNVSGSDTAKMKYYAEKNQIYGYLEKHSKDIKELNVSDDKEVHYEHNGNKISYTLTDGGLIYSDGKITQTFATIKDIDFTMLEEVCYDNKDGQEKCEKVTNVLQVITYTNRGKDEKLQLSRSRRCFYIG